MARVLVIFRHAPHGRVDARETLDVALAALAFDHAVSVYFCGAGVDCLRAEQAPDAIGAPAIARNLRALAAHGAERIGVDAEALRARGLSASDLQLPAIGLEGDTAAQWLADAEHVFNG